MTEIESSSPDPMSLEFDTTREVIARARASAIAAEACREEIARTIIESDHRVAQIKPVLQAAGLLPKEKAVAATFGRVVHYIFPTERI